MGSLVEKTAPGSAGVAGASMSKSFIPRQPIFDLKQNVFAYELLFRSGLDNAFKSAEPNQASAKVMSDGVLLMSIEALSGGKLAFINLTRDILLNDFISLQKDTALVSVIGTIDAFNQAKMVASNHFNLSSVTTVAILFVIITIPQARFVDRMMAADQRRMRAAG